MVLDNNLEMAKVIKIPNSITKNIAKVETIVDQIPRLVPAINIEAIVIKKGNLPVTRDKIIGKYRN